MPSELGPFLRQLRLARQISQVEAARLTGIGRVTLNRWESGAQQPREVEIEALLAALNAMPEERRQLAALYQTAGTRLRVRDLLVQVGAQEGIGSLPQGGDLLRTLRLRRNLSQAEAAACIGVTGRTLRRWEKSEIWPSLTQLETLCCVLGAHPAEAAALAEGYFEPGMTSPNGSLEALRQQGKELHASYQQSPQQSLKDLGFLTLESQVWPFAAHSVEGREVLAQLYGYHAHYLDSLGRFTESGLYAQQSLDLIAGTPPLWGVDSPCIMMAARAAIYRGTRLDVGRGIEVIRHWVDVPQEPAYKAWLLSDLAKYTTQMGDGESGLALANRAIMVARPVTNHIEPLLRELDKAQVLIMDGKPQHALRFIEHETELDYHLPIQFNLLQAEAHLRLHNAAVAHDHLQDAMTLIKDMTAPSLLPQAQKLARQL